MTPSPSARSQGAAIRQARHARIRGIRRRVIALALALFIATWLLITITLASGHDPALAANAAKVSATSAAATGTSTQATSTQGSGTSTQGSGTSAQGSGTSSQSSGTSALTSSQS